MARPVRPAEPPAVPAGSAGDLAELTAYKDHLRALLDDATARDAPALTRELRILQKEIRELRVPEEASELDRVRAARAARIAAASGQ